MTLRKVRRQQMQLPILHKLKDGVKFDFATLAHNIEQTEEFLAWWWEEKFKPGKISRPEVIADDDGILVPTSQKPLVDLTAYSEFFDRSLWRLVREGVLPALQDIPRDIFHSAIVRMVAANNSIKLSGRPQIIFAGGGYGSGKSTMLNYMTKAGALPVGLEHLAGVDVFKQLIPEYNLIKAVADGRASLTVQNECYELGDDLFGVLVENGRSFVWDSSMSNKVETLQKIKLATENGYELTMVAVLTPEKQATEQAMHRAKETRRYPNPDALPKSHTGFRKAFMDYVEHFDEITVFANDARLGDSPVVLGHKAGKENALVPVAEGLLESALGVKDAK